MDADLQHEPESVPDVAKPVLEGGGGRWFSGTLLLQHPLQPMERSSPTLGFFKDFFVGRGQPGISIGSIPSWPIDL